MFSKLMNRLVNSGGGGSNSTSQSPAASTIAGENVPPSMDTMDHSKSINTSSVNMSSATNADNSLIADTATVDLMLTDHSTAAPVMTAEQAVPVTDIPATGGHEENLSAFDSVVSLASGVQEPAIQTEDTSLLNLSTIPEIQSPCEVRPQIDVHKEVPQATTVDTAVTNVLEDLEHELDSELMASQSAEEMAVDDSQTSTHVFDTPIETIIDEQEMSITQKQHLTDDPLVVEEESQMPLVQTNNDHPMLIVSEHQEPEIQVDANVHEVHQSKPEDALETAGTSRYLASPPPDEQNESFSPSEFEDAVEDTGDLEKAVLKSANTTATTEYFSNADDEEHLHLNSSAESRTIEEDDKENDEEDEYDDEIRIDDNYSALLCATPTAATQLFNRHLTVETFDTEDLDKTPVASAVADTSNGGDNSGRTPATKTQHAKNASTVLMSTSIHAANLAHPHDGASSTFTKSPVAAHELKTMNNLGESTINFDSMVTSGVSMLNTGDIRETDSARQSLYVVADDTAVTPTDEDGGESITGKRSELAQSTGTTPKMRTPKSAERSVTHVIDTNTIKKPPRPQKDMAAAPRDTDTDSVSDLELDKLLRDTGAPHNNLRLTSSLLDDTMIIQPQHSSNGNAESIDNDGDETMTTTTRTVKLTHHNGFSQEFGLVKHQQKSSPKNDHDDDQQDVAQPTPSATDSNVDEVAQKLKLQFQAVLLTKEREWAANLQKQKRQVEKLNEEVRSSKREASTLKAQNEQLQAFANECRNSLSNACSELSQRGGNVSASTLATGESVDQLIHERDDAITDMRSVESAFSDLHRRYERVRDAVETAKDNEEKLRGALVEAEAKNSRLEERFGKLREHAEMKLEKANSEIERLQKAREQDTLGLRAQLKKRELQVDTLEKAIEQKNKEISELTGICDELIQSQQSAD